jgi:hypothetical protein
MTSRALVLSAMLLTCVSLAGITALGTPPAATDSGVVAWLRMHHNGVRWSVLAGTASAPLLAFVVALLRRLLPPPHRDVFLIGAAAVGVAIAVQSWSWGGLALHADRVEPATARTLWDGVPGVQQENGASTVQSRATSQVLSPSGQSQAGA